MKNILSKLLLFFLSSSFSLSIFAQEYIKTEDDILSIDSLILKGNIDEVRQNLFMKDSIDRFILLDLDELGDDAYSEIMKKRYLTLIKRVNILKNYPDDQVGETYSRFVEFSSSFSPDQTGKNSVEAFQKYEECLNRNEIQDAAKYFLVAVFFRIKFLQYYRNEFKKISEAVIEDINRSNLIDAFRKQSELDSAYHAIPSPEYSITRTYEMLKIRLTKIAESVRDLSDFYYPKDFSFNIGLSLSRQPGNSFSSFENYSGPNPSFSNEKYYYDYELPSRVGFGVSADFNFNFYSSFYLGLDIKFYNYQYELLNLIINDSYLYKFSDLYVKSLSYHVNITYKFFELTHFHPFLKIGFGTANIKRSSTLVKGEVEDILGIFYNRKICNILYKYEDTYNELELGLGIEVFPLISNRFSSTFILSKGIQLGEPTLPDNFPVSLKLMFGYYWEY